ncbi:GTPase [Longispora sp. K20-0274]|uniref:GTPase n=1 Tax=Longispora sp. K20-0274 TaxID=3088255 RepID=UPI00399B87DD
MRPRPRPLALPSRLRALRKFVAVAGDRLPAADLAPARAVLERAGQRLDMSREHTVVALAGATGSGKSSMFNALAGLELSDVGVRRPTTARTQACVWGPEGSGELLEWLRLPSWHARETVLDADEQAALRGLILLDLPDFDSTAAEHRAEAERLLDLVDLVVWVLDPQKYADNLVHERYLSRFRRHRDVTVVVLNKVDTLPPDGARACLEDLHGLLRSHSLGAVPVLGASTVTGEGVAELHTLIEKAVTGKRAATSRLGADVDTVAGRLSAFVGPPAAEITPHLVRGASAALAATAGVDAVAQAAGASYLKRGVSATGWPLTRWWGRLRRDPLKRLHLDPVARTSVPPPTPARRAAATLAVRDLADQASRGLPEPWPAAVRDAARADEGDLSDALDRAVGTTAITARNPRWWRFVGVLQWLLALCALAGALWLLVRLGLGALGIDLPLPKQGIVPVPTLLLGAGLLAGLLLTVVTRPLLRIGARRTERRATSALLTAVDLVTEEHVVAPVRAELSSYEDARRALESL